MYEIYQTKGWVIKSYTKSETNQRVLIFTKDFGLIWINVSGSKKDKSKMRNFLTNSTFAEFFLVQGKGGYRLTGGKYLKNIFLDIYKSDKKDKKKIETIKNIFNLIEKIIIKNEREENIFHALKTFLENIDKKNLKNLKEVEVLFLTEMFYILGYFDENDFPKSFDHKKDTTRKSENIQNQKLKENEVLELRKKINQNMLRYF